MEQFWEYFAVLAPSVGVFIIFWFVYKAITRADALERETEAEIRAQAGMTDTPTAVSEDAEESAETDSPDIEENRPS
ncbi:hypothetical protein [Micrococcoides hystricis]|uniref:Lysyl-tRNA synthetase n=1 Tax=Micrococcoides hystricis TaxID=1572761 RepID=A0ABV6PB57_9MICC